MPTLPLYTFIIFVAFVLVLIETLIGVKSGKFLFGKSFLENDEDKPTLRSVMIFYRVVLLIGFAIASVYTYLNP